MNPLATLSPPAGGSAPLDHQGWLPLGEYAVIGNCHTAALVSATGWIEWLCLPRFDSPSVFAALLDPARGGCLQTGVLRVIGSRRRYRASTPVLETDVIAQGGRLRITDFMPAHHEVSLPGSLPTASRVCRIIECTDGAVGLIVGCLPRPGYAAAPAPISPDSEGGWVASADGQSVRVRTDLPLKLSRDGLRCTQRLRRGERRWLIVEDGAARGVASPFDLLDSTVTWWRRWADGLRYDGPYRREVLRSAVTLKLLCYAPTGAVVAAPTTSLPEVPSGGSNWDYRYCWIRDASMCVRALIRSGFSDEAKAFLAWLVKTPERFTPALCVLYTVDGEHDVPERTLRHLAGYRGAQPVRVGNAAHKQLQLDVYGALIDAVHVHVEAGGCLRPETASMLVALGKQVCSLWRRPDNGIWETRQRLSHHTLSKAMCWTALDRLVRLHDAGELDAPVARFRREAALVREAVERSGVDSAGHFTVSFGEDAVDPSLLLMDLYGYEPRGSPRMLATLRRIDERLGPPPLLNRHLARATLPRGWEGAFTVAGFWAVEVLAGAGLVDEAEERFEAILNTANDLGLFAEETTRPSGALAGNFPQGFSHVGLLNAAQALASARGHQRAVHHHPRGSPARREPL